MDFRLDYANIEVISDKAVNIFKNLYNSAIKKKGFFSVIICGGKSPLLFYSKLNEQSDIDFSKIFFFISDERITKEISELNYVAIESTLFRNIKDFNFHKIDPLIPNPSENYNLSVTSFISENHFFDASFLGIGADGHVASLFEKEYNKHDFVIETYNENYRTPRRISLNFSALNLSSISIFIVSGSGKDKVVSDIINGKGEYPCNSIKTPKHYLIDCSTVNLML